MAKLSEYGSINSSKNVKKMDEVEGKPLTIEGFSTVEGDYGEYAMIKVKDAEGSEFTVMTGASLIIEALEDVKAKNAFPVDATFIKRGRAWICD